MSDVIAVLSWWLVIQILGFAVWPLVIRWLRWLPDRGYMLAKPIGLLIVTYTLWLLANFGVVWNSTGGIIVVVIAVAVLSLWAYRTWSRGRGAGDGLLDALREKRTLFIAYEILFVAALIGWAIFRAHNPDLFTTEKPMEFAFFNAIGRSPTMPPHDPWLAGYAIAYYYFGYVMMSLLYELSGVTAGTAFSMSNAFWFALSAASAFAVVANLVLSFKEKAQEMAIGFGVLGAVLLVLMGNFEAPLEIAHANNVGSAGFWQSLDILDINGPPVQNPPDVPIWEPRPVWWWWRASRVIHDYPPDAVSPHLSSVTGLPSAPNTTYQEVIDEFPQFSFLLGDMHPHVLALPYALLMMALALNLYQGAARGEVKSLAWGKQSAPLWLLYALAVGGLSFLNTWDFPIYAFVLAAALALGYYRAGSFRLWDSLLDLITLGIVGVLFYIPFYRGFTSQAAGIAPNLYNGTRFIQFFVMFGPFLIIGLMFGLALLSEAVHTRHVRVLSFTAKALGGGIAIVVGLAVLAGSVGFLITRVSERARAAVDGVLAAMASAGLSPSDHLLARVTDPWVPLGLGIALAAIVLLWHVRRSGPFAAAGNTDRLVVNQLQSATPIDFVLLLYAIGLLLTLGTEFGFIIDGFGNRMNTVFKFYYQAWALWSVASAFGAYYLLRGSEHIKPIGRTVAAIVVVIVVGLGLVYPAIAIPSKIDQGVTPTLDALSNAALSAPDDYVAAKWFNESVSGTPIILEAPGEEYNAGTSRISTWTGLPTVIGWGGHEGQWRGSYDLQGPRIADVNEIYTTGDMNQALLLLRSHGVRYVVVGSNERRQYPPPGLVKFDQNLPVVFKQGDMTVYEVP